MSGEIIIPTSVSEVLADIDAGVLERIASKSLCDMAANVMDQKRKGKLIITLELEHIKNTQQVNIKSSVKAHMPTMDNGDRTETVKRDTAMFVGKYGKLSLVPEAQLDLPGISKKAGETIANNQQQ